MEQCICQSAAALRYLRHQFYHSFVFELCSTTKTLLEFYRTLTAWQMTFVQIFARNVQIIKFTIHFFCELQKFNKNHPQLPHKFLPPRNV